MTTYSVYFLNKNSGQIVSQQISGESYKEVLRKAKEVEKSKEDEYSFLYIEDSQKKSGNISSVKEKKENLFLLPFRREKVIPYIEQAKIYKQIASMVEAGLPLGMVIGEVVNGIDKKNVKEVFENIQKKIESGQGLYSASQKYSNKLGKITMSIFKLADNAGNIPKNLIILSEMLDGIAINVKKIKKAMRYPLVVITSMIIAFILMILLVVPKFKDIFGKFHAELPLPTQVLLGIEYVFENYGILVLFIFVISIVLFRYFYKNDYSFRYKVDYYLTKIYLIKDIIVNSEYNRFFYILGNMISTGINLDQSLQIAIDSVKNEYIKAKLNKVYHYIESGSSLSEAFLKIGIFDNLVIQLIKTGEAAGNLEEMILKISKFYEEKLNDFIDNIQAYIEPILLAGLAGMVLLLALGIFLPMWDLASVMKK